jgi:hypothetical protein
MRVVCVATKGPGSNEEERILWLLRDHAPEAWPFDRTRKGRSALRLARRALRDRPDVIVLEGTGVAMGLAVMALRIAAGIPYVVSSGDAVGPFVAAHVRFAGLAAALYERALCRLSAGYIGWTPYLVGRALAFGAPRAMTAAGFAPFGTADEERAAVRAELEIPPDAIVFGIVGSLRWNERRRYCYGLELVRSLTDVSRDDVYVVVAGDGSGRDRLVEAATRGPRERIRLLGPVAQDSVPRLLAAMDVGSLPQSVDRVGAYRYTTKLSEYVAARLPVVTGEIPLAYDLDDGWIWRLPGDAPWDQRYISALTELMRTVTRDEVESKRARVPRGHPDFDRDRQRRRAGDFIGDATRRARGRAGA